jgi:hypothetical protein
METDLKFMQMFCGERRAATAEPSSFDGWVYATDGVVIIRIKGDVPSKVRLELGEKYRDAFTRFPESMVPPLPLPGHVAASLCRVCGATTHEPITVDDDGDCSNCYGLGTKPLTHDRIGGVKVGGAYSHLIRQLPGLQVRGGLRNNMTCVYFRFTGGEGILMGCEE